MRPVVLGDLRIEKLAAQRFEAFERAFLVRPHQPRIPRHIGGEDRGETAGLAHVASPAASRRPDRKSSRCSRVPQMADVRHHDRRDGPQPRDDLSCVVEPTHMGVAGGEISDTVREAWILLDREEQFRHSLIEAPADEMCRADYNEATGRGGRGD